MKKNKADSRKILLSFDTEEFDGPREQGVPFTLAQGMEVSRRGVGQVLDLLQRQGVKATFFCTANFAENAPDLMHRIVAEGHEVACHGCDHFEPQPSDVEQSKVRVERVVGQPTYGYRQPRMFAVDEREVARMGYQYNSSLNPAFIPGRYMHLDTPRTCFVKEGVLQIPASVTPWFRIPLFWLALHLMPEWLYAALVRRVLRKVGYFVTYFHPWEFYDLGGHPEFHTPCIIRYHSGQCLAERLERFIGAMKRDGAQFVTYHHFADTFPC